MNVAALIISCNEPQMERCVEAVRSQLVPFSSIIHINGMSPEYTAFNEGLSAIKEDYFMKIDGDMILSVLALKTVLESVLFPEPNVYCYNFRVYDTFLKANLRGTGLMNTEIVRKVPYVNILDNDRYFGRGMSRLGYRKINMGPVVATHMEDPDQFQIFHRFYCMGVKHGTRYHLVPLMDLYASTKDPIYLFAMDALRFGEKTRKYPGSHDINFDMEIYKEFCDNNNITLV